jgi:hypothetical protein
MTHVLGNRRWTGTIASIGLLLAVTGCTAAGSDGGASAPPASTSASEAAPPTSSETASPTSSESASDSPSSAPAQTSAAPSTAPSPSETPSPSVSPSDSPSAAPVPAPSPSASTPAADGICTAAQLTGAVEDQPGGAAAGSVYRTLLLTNASDRSCTLEGYPGVSFVDAAGNQLGAPAERDGSALRTVTLAPGATAASTLRQTNAQNYGPECGLTTSAGLRVYPPGATDSLVLPQEIAACTAGSVSLMSIGTLQATS